MNEKGIDFEDVLREQLKDLKFRKAYDEVRLEIEGDGS